MYILKLHLESLNLQLNAIYSNIELKSVHIDTN